VKDVGESGVESVQVYFPGGGHLLWFSAQLDGTFYPGTGLTDVPVTIDRIPVFYRRGSIIVTKQTSRPSTTDMKDDDYTLFQFLKNVMRTMSHVSLFLLFLLLRTRLLLELSTLTIILASNTEILCDTIT
jgi:alpha-glucosidase (family GH31 glycosyl hydrolase)